MNKQIRKEVKAALIAQNGKFFDQNVMNISNAYGCRYSDVKKAYNYFRFSPQQKGFREVYNVY